MMHLQVVDTEKYDVVCVSPRNHFVFTPMLPSSAIGTVEFRSLLEPIRISNPFVTYVLTMCSETCTAVTFLSHHWDYQPAHVIP